MASLASAFSTESSAFSKRSYNRALERLIVRRPEQWWWVHRRWKPWPARKRAS
jgi:lauroyl/myristoyl acyltransferase